MPSLLSLLLAGPIAVVSVATAQTVNALTEAEQAAGWQLMFDGKTLAGWHSFRKPAITDNGWIIRDSSIYLRGNAFGGFAVGALLAPEPFAYRNFEIAIDWKLPDSGNSGIFLRYLETEENEATRTGPETQICGRLHPDYRGGTAVTSPGACYAMYAPAQAWIRPADRYNTLHVVMYENKVAHFGNGVKLLEYVIGDSGWTARYKDSKYNSFPLYGDVHAGKLFLQDHASHVWYRNIKIRPLSNDPWTDPAFAWPDKAAGVAAWPLRAHARADRARSTGRGVAFRALLPGPAPIGAADGNAGDWRDALGRGFLPLPAEP